MYILGTKEMGRYATRVRINSPQGSRYDGREGVVVRTVDRTVFVRLSSLTGDVTLPFGLTELEIR